MLATGLPLLILKLSQWLWARLTTCILPWSSFLLTIGCQSRDVTSGFNMTMSPSTESGRSPKFSTPYSPNRILRNREDWSACHRSANGRTQDGNPVPHRRAQPANFSKIVWASVGPKRSTLDPVAFRNQSSVHHFRPARLPSGLHNLVPHLGDLAVLAADRRGSKCRRSCAPRSSRGSSRAGPIISITCTAIFSHDVEPPCSARHSLWRSSSHHDSSTY